MNTAEEKRRTRGIVQKRIAAMSNEEKTKESNAVCDVLLREVSPTIRVVCGFVPLKDEVDLRPLLESLLQKGIFLYLPVFETGSMIFRRVENLTDLMPGAYGTSEPHSSAPLLEPSSAELVLVPGRAFDASGRRMGRGKGAYDAWITTQRKANPRTQYWGIGFDCQLFPAIPSEEHDQLMDAVVSVRGMTQTKH